MPRSRVLVLTTLAMLAFAGNSLLCRLALSGTSIDAGSFTSVRIVSGALTLWIIVVLRGQGRGLAGNWVSAAALFAYAAGFSLAYIKLSAATGALLLFGAVQATMIGYGFLSGDRLRGWQIVGFVCAVLGLVALLLPGLAAPPLHSAALMVGAGIAWGIYSLRGRGAGDPTSATAGNFVRAVPFAAVLSLIMLSHLSLDAVGIAYAVASGALTSGLGYAIWYTALKGLKATSAATVQLSVPVIATIGGALLLGEHVTMRIVIASVAILGGIALVILNRGKMSG
ncbi:MAG TPA: DMT family transporter [Steroidobacteraceae bacterium]|nr:DMT family transporter [Steroidobacteraceae bacterium]